MRWIGATVCVVALCAALAAPARAASGNGQIVAVGAGDSLVTLNPDGSGMRTIWSAPGAADVLSAPAWSPDGNQIAFALADAQHGGRIVVHDLATGQLRAVTDHSADVRDSDPSWTPDGSGILFTRSATIDGTAGYTLAFVPVRAGVDPPQPPFVFDPLGLHVALSPDGARLAVVAESSGGLGVAPVPGPGSLTPLATTALGTPAWSPDATRLAFADGDASSAHLQTVPAAGGPPSDLTAAASAVRDSGPGWAPDGSQVVYAHDDSGPAPVSELRATSADGASTRVVAHAAGRAGALSEPDWQPCAPTTVSCTSVAPPQCAATAAATTQAGQPLEVPVPCLDPAGRPLMIVIVSGPAHGTLAVGADGRRRYTPDAGFSGSDSLVLRANNGVADSGLSRVTIFVVPLPSGVAAQPAVRRAPFLNARATPRLDSRGRVLLRASCDQDCTLSLRLTARLRTKRTLQGPVVKHRLVATHVLSLRLHVVKSGAKPPARSRVKTIWVTGTVRNASGEVRAVKLPVTVPRR
jgi:hypothetical protein